MPDLISPQEAGQLLGLTPGSLRRLLARGIVTGVILPSGHARYDRDSVEALTVSVPYPNVKVIERSPE